jgi:hypothetical protein
MTDLVRALENFVSLFEQMSLPYAVMGGIAVRVYGIPRPTYDIDITIAIERQRLPELYTARQSALPDTPCPKNTQVVGSTKLPGCLLSSSVYT